MNFSIHLIPKIINNSNFLSLFYSKPLREDRNLKLKHRDTLLISKYDEPFGKGYKPQFIQEVFQIAAISSIKHPAYTIKNEEEEVVRGSFYQKDLVKVI